MCRHCCELDNESWEYESASLYFGILGKEHLTLSLNAHGKVLEVELGEKIWENFPVRYCPWCGRKL